MDGLTPKFRHWPAKLQYQKQLREKKQKLGKSMGLSIPCAADKKGTPICANLIIKKPR